MRLYPNQVFHIDIPRDFVCERSEADFVSGSFQAEPFKEQKTQRAVNSVVVNKTTEGKWQYVIYIHKEDGRSGEADTLGGAIGLAGVELYKWETQKRHRQ